MTAKTIPGGFVIEQTIRIAAPRETVFDLLGSRDQIARWFRASVFEQRPGGRVELVFPAEPDDYVMLGEVTAYDPPKRIAYTWDFRNAPLEARTEVSFELTTEGDETIVHLKHAGFVDEAQSKGHQAGWTYWLGRLEKVAEGRDPGLDSHAAVEERRAVLAALRREEIELKEHTERVARMRRDLPPGVAVEEDYALTALDGNIVKLTELFGDKDELLLYHYMWKPDDDRPCNMCTLWIDGFNGVAAHVADRAAFAVVAKAHIDKLRPWAQGRGWQRIRLASSYGTTFNTDFAAEDSDGDQVPCISVFRKTPEGVLHYYQKGAELAEGHNRGIDLLSPVWNLFDLLPSGRGDWEPRFEY